MDRGIFRLSQRKKKNIIPFMYRFIDRFKERYCIERERDIEKERLRLVRKN